MRCYFYSGVSKRSRKALREAANRFASVVDIRHKLTIHVAPEPIDTCDMRANMVSLGVFGDFADHPRIFLASVPGHGLEIDGEWHGDERYPVNVFAHELVHYEQFRDGRNLTERGTAVRSRTILKKAGYEC